MNKIVCGIVLYNPEIELLKKNIESISRQVNKIILIDNNSDNSTLIKESFNKSNLIIIQNKVNNGTATAFNQLIKYAKDNNYDWFLQLDQDSVCSSNLIEEYYKYVFDEKIALISPKIIYQTENNSLKYRKSGEKKDIEEIEFAIASGSLVRTNVAIKLYGYDENIFLDYVDFEFCIRIKKKGYKIIRNNNAFLIHHLGNLTIKRFFGKQINVTNHTTLRRYYYAYNLHYISKKHPDFISHKFVIKKLFLKSIVILLYETDKISKIGAIVRGYRKASQCTY